MKKFLILLVVLVVGALAVPAVVGYQAEARYQGMLAHMTRSGFEVVESEYQRGWFSSRAETQLRLPMARPAASGEVDASELRFGLRSDITHGPLSGADGEIMVAEIATEVVSKDGVSLFPGETTKLLRTRIDMNGNGLVEIDLPKLKSEPGEGRLGVQFDGLTGSLSFDAGFSGMVLDMRLPLLRMSGQQGQHFKLQEATLNSNTKKGVSGLMLGDVAFEVKHLELKDPQKETDMDLSGFKILVDSGAEGDQILFNALYALQTVDVDGKQYGPAELEIVADRLSAPALAKMQRAMDELNAKPMSDGERAMAAMGAMMETASELLQNDPTLAVKRFRAETPDGAIKGDFFIQPVGLKADEIMNASVLLGKLKVSGSLRMPEPLFQAFFEQQARAEIQQLIAMRRKMGEEIEDLPEDKLRNYAEAKGKETLDQLLRQELLVRDGDDLVTAGELSNGLLTVNGKTIALPTGQPPQMEEPEEQMEEQPEEEQAPAQQEEEPLQPEESAKAETETKG